MTSITFTSLPTLLICIASVRKSLSRHNASHDVCRRSDSHASCSGDRPKSKYDICHSFYLDCHRHYSTGSSGRSYSGTPPPQAPHMSDGGLYAVNDDCNDLRRQSDQQECPICHILIDATQPQPTYASPSQTPAQHEAYFPPLQAATMLQDVQLGQHRGVLPGGYSGYSQPPRVFDIGDYPFAHTTHARQRRIRHVPFHEIALPIQTQPLPPQSSCCEFCHAIDQQDGLAQLPIQSQQSPPQIACCAIYQEFDRQKIVATPPMAVRREPKACTYRAKCVGCGLRKS